MASTYDNKKFWRDFIRTYRNLPALWKVKSDAYKNRTRKSQAYKVLVEKLREVAPGADREMAKKKINALRTNYRREFKKMKELEAKHVVYEPKLWYFRDIDFLRDMEMTGDDNDRDDEGSRLLVGEESLLAKEHSTSISSSETPIQTPAPARDVTVKREPSEDVHVVDDAPCQPVNAYSDEAEILAKIWASEYDQLRPDQRLFAKKAINDVLFEARLGTLTRYSVTINESHLAAPSSSYYVNSSSLVESPGCSISVEEPDVKRPR